MPTKSTSFRLAPSTLTLLKQLAEKENRSLTNMVETLIIDRSKGDSKMKDWMTEVPQTDSEAEAALMFDKSDLVGKNLVGIFQIKRAQGLPLLEAYEAALRAYIEVSQKVS